MSNFMDTTFDIDYKKWYCFDTKCPWYKTKMTIENNLVHLIKIHKMKPPVGYQLPNKIDINKKKNKNKKNKRGK